MASAPPSPRPGVLTDPGRVAAARRLLAEASPGVHDRLARLAAQLTSAPGTERGEDHRGTTGGGRGVGATTPPAG